MAREIATLETQLKPLLDRMATLRRKERDALSREFIAANRITRDDVEMSSSDGKEWFGTAHEFGKWIAANSKKLWAEWNGIIYHATDLVNGRMPDMPGEVDHLPNSSYSQHVERRYPLFHSRHNAPPIPDLTRDFWPAGASIRQL